jgi:hypothetical protein
MTTVGLENVVVNLRQFVDQFLASAVALGKLLTAHRVVGALQSPLHLGYLKAHTSRIPTAAARKPAAMKRAPLE